MLSKCTHNAGEAGVLSLRLLIFYINSQSVIVIHSVCSKRQIRYIFLSYRYIYIIYYNKLLHL